MRKLIVILVVFIFALPFLGNSQTVTTPPSGTVISTSSADSRAHALPGGQTYTHTNTSWPSTYSPCFSFGVNDTLIAAINGHNTLPPNSACTGMTNLIYNPGSSNLAAGVIVYTGTTTYKYLNTSNVYVINASIPVRATITFSQAVTYYSNSTFVIPVTGNFNYNVLFECYSPIDAQYFAGAGNQWTPAITLFNNLHTDPMTSICTAYNQGDYYSNIVTASTANSGTYCAGTNVNLTGGGTGNNVTYTWTGPNSFFSAGANATILNSSISNSGQYIFTATNDLGCKDTVQVQITINPGPVATSGGTAVICQNSTATVTGASAANGTINWNHNGSGSISNANTLTPTYTPSPSDAGNTVVLTLTVTSTNACSPSTATATFNVIVEGMPVAIDGVTSSGCSTSNIPVTTATANFGTISWTHNGSGTLTNGNTSSPTYTPGPSDNGNTIILTLTVTSTNSCGPASATAYHFINVTPLPQAVAGGTSTICQNSTVTVTGASAQYGTISWTHNGTGTITNASTLSPTYTPGAGDVGNIVALTMTVSSNNACAPAIASADYTINVVGLPQATGGNSVTTCSNTPVVISGATGQFGTFSWTHNGSGSITNGTTLTPTYTPSSTDAGNTVILTLTVASNNSCAPQSASATCSITVNHLPTASVTGSATICQNGTYQITTANATYGSINWTSNGVGSITNGTTLTPTYTAAPGDAGNVVTLTMTVTSNNACAPQSTTATFNIIVQKLPVAIAGGTTTVCLTTAAPVAGVTATNGTISWTHNGNGNLLNATTSGPTYQPNLNDAGDTITLTLTVTSNNSCAPQTATATYTIIVDSLPKAFAGGQGYTCVNNSATPLNPYALNGTPTWSTTGSGTLTNNNTLNPTYTPNSNEAGSDVILTLTVNSNNSCAPSTHQAQYILHIDSLPVAQTPLYDTICPGGIYTISGASAQNGTVFWTHNGNGTLLNPTSLTPTYNGVSSDAGNTISFILTVTSDNACAPQTASSTYQVFVENSSNAPIIQLDSIHNVSCNGMTDGSIFVSILNGSSPFNYLWQPTNSITEDLENQGAGTYLLTIMDSYGCSDSQSFVITEPQPLQISGVVVPVDCSGTFGRINVQVSGGTPGYNYVWSPTGDTSFNVVNLVAGTHTVTVTDSNGCNLTQSYLVDIIGNLTVNATPNNANVNIGSPTIISATGASNYSWTPSTDLNCDTCSTVICTPFSSQTYIVTGTTPNGCIGYDTVTITMYIDCSNLCMPSMFSPNEEGPIENNTFGLLGQYPCIEEYQLMIFNRWGEMVFETIDYKAQWDGTYKGKPLNSGVFVYKLNVKTIEGNEIKKSGNVTLVR